MGWSQSGIEPKASWVTLGPSLGPRTSQWQTTSKNVCQYNYKEFSKQSLRIKQRQHGRKKMGWKVENMWLAAVWLISNRLILLLAMAKDLWWQVNFILLWFSSLQRALTSKRIGADLVNGMAVEGRRWLDWWQPYGYVLYWTLGIQSCGQAKQTPSFLSLRGNFRGE